MGCRDDTKPVVCAHTGDDVSDLSYSRDFVRDLQAENQDWQELAQRQLEEFTVTTAKYRAEKQRLEDVQRDLDLAHADEVNALRAEAAGSSKALEDAEAENQQLREALQKIADDKDYGWAYVAREALAGDAE